ncbi:MAG: hypothetical protein IJT79_06710 [Ruminococcus sp.]|nr:hypothetical protein [Ruminococcus sp.]
MKKVLSVLCVVLFIAVTLCSCGSNTLVGSWICEEVHNGYPDAMTLNDDGTGIVDGTNVSWWVDADKNVVHFNATYDSKKCDFYFEGDTLYLDDYAYTRKN